MSTLDLREFSCFFFKYDNCDKFLITRNIDHKQIGVYTVTYTQDGVIYEDLDSHTILTPTSYPETINALKEVISLELATSNHPRLTRIREKLRAKK